MTEETVKRVLELHEQIEELNKVLNFCHPNRNVVLDVNEFNVDVLVKLCNRYEYEICEVFLRYKRKLETELEKI